MKAAQTHWLNLMPDAVALFDSTGLITVMNNEFEKLLKESVLISPDNLTCERLDEQLIKLALPESQIKTIDYKERSLQAVTPPPESLILLDHPKFRVIQKIIRFENGDDDIGGLIHIKDITSNYLINQSKTEFLCTTAHELRAPMANIFGYSELLVNNHYENDTQKEMQKVIYQETARMLKILNDLLDLAKIEAQEKSTLDLDRHYVSDIVNNVINTQKHMLKQHKVSVTTQDEMPVPCNQQKIEQVLINILNNSVKYSDYGTSIQINIKKANHQQTPCICIEIVDQGIGMSPKELSQIFNRFYRGLNHQAEPGTGLGMNIVKEIIKLHSGTINISSIPNSGTKVSILLPA